MPKLTGADRNQLQMMSLEGCIDEDNPVRVIDALIDLFDLDQLGFITKGHSREGRPAYGADILLKLYLYGYQNRIRSSRMLAKACIRNLEVMWLVQMQRPCYKTIADFRKDNSKALKAAFRQFNMLLKDWGMFGGQTIAVDGSKFRAQNSKKNNYNDKKVQQHLAYIDEQTQEFIQQLDEADQIEDQNNQDQQATHFRKKLEQLKNRRQKYEALADQLAQNDQTQISTTDEDARALPRKMNIVEVAYNVQTAVDDQHNLVVHYEATNQHDTYALPQIAGPAKDFLQVETIDALADKGYHTGSALKACAELQINPYVAPRNQAHQGKHQDFRTEKFTYFPIADVYQCPQGAYLKTNGTFYHKKNTRRRTYRFKRYTAEYKHCAQCPFKLECVGNRLKHHHGRSIERSEYADYIEANAQRVKENKAYYRRRQAIVEHPFGTIKRQWGFNYTLLKGLQKVDGEFGLVFLSYNLTRVISILGVRTLVRHLKAALTQLFGAFRALLGHFEPHSKRNRFDISGPKIGYCILC